MALLAVEKKATEATTPISSYNQDLWSIGTLIFKHSSASPVYIGPTAVKVARPVEQAAAIPGVYPWVMQWSPTVDWCFLSDNAATSATRRVELYTVNRSTDDAPSFMGFITITFPTATTHFMRGFRMTYDKYITGTAAVSGTAVTGTSTTWLASCLAVGSRIGFGSTNPNNITTWYEISAIGSDTGITLTQTAGTITDGPYVIEELRAVMASLNATTTNGGLYVVKGLRFENFSPGGTAIPAATTVDNIRAAYWLADAAVVTNIAAVGCCLENRADWLTHYAYLPDTTGGIKMYKYNIRKNLALTAGKDTTAFVYATGSQAVTGTVSATNNGRIGTLNHGPGSGVLSLYFVTTTRVYRCAVSGITIGSTTFLTDAAIEVPPGSTTTYAATGALACVELASNIDRLVITSTGASAVRSYVTQYRTDSGQWDHIFLADDKQLDQATASSDITPHGTTNSVTQTPRCEGGLLYIVGVGTTAVTNIMRIMPIGADWQYAATTSQRAISPRMTTTNNLAFNSVYAIRDTMVGSINLGRATEPIRAWYRTSGISDNTGSWTLVADGNDLSGVAGTAEIQLMFEFMCISDTCIPGRLFRVGATYNDITTDTHYQPSSKWTDETAKQFAWRFSTGFGGTVPTLYIRLYDAVTQGLLLTDNTATPTGTWEKSTNGGGAWGAYDTSDKGNETTYIRYTPASLADNIRVRFHLSQS